MTSAHHQRWIRIGPVLALALAAALWAVPARASVFAEEVAEISSYARLYPARALDRLNALQGTALLAPPSERGEYMSQVGQAQLHTGLHDDASATAQRLLLLADLAASKPLRIKGLLLSANVLAARGQRDQAHQLLWQAHQLASGDADLPLRLQADIAAGQAYAEAGRYKLALATLLRAVDTARQQGGPALTISALQTLADLYENMHDYARGIAAVDEALALARGAGNDGQVAVLRITEFALANGLGDKKRGIAALRSALAWAHEHEVDEVAAVAHANLADSYLEIHKPELAIQHAGQALRMASFIGDELVAAVARMNLGHASLMLGRLEVGKRYLERGIEAAMRTADKASIVTYLDDYGKSLELAGDAPAALSVAHRARRLAEQLNNEQRSREVAEVQEQYEAGKRQQQLERLRRANAQREAELASQKRRQVVVLAMAALALAAAVLMAVLLARLRRAHQQLRDLSIRDPLTALFNRRHFQQLMSTRLAGDKRQIRRAADEVGLMIVLDVDHFKRVNDTHGHAAGDAVLRTVAQALRAILRETDMIVRWGGEEFLAYIDAVPSADVDDVARRILAGIARTAADYQGTAINVTVSVGFAQVPLAGQRGVTLERVIALADQALYLAKQSGRNRAYGLRRVADNDAATLDRIEHQLQQAAAEGLVDLVAVTP